ncbi:MAG: hypothetical protein COA84_07665 [Robiginitomaculum sp.]|nr:MAG: hypothetical protein COA84_07665 [Robiginitomaculum sp.]
MTKPIQYRTKSCQIEAIEFDGTDVNAMAIIKWATGSVISYDERMLEPEYMTIQTLEGSMTASPGDFIIKGLLGEFYPCKPQVFHQKYEAVEVGA